MFFKIFFIDFFFLIFPFKKIEIVYGFYEFFIFRMIFTNFENLFKLPRYSPFKRDAIRKKLVDAVEPHHRLFSSITLRNIFQHINLYIFFCSGGSFRVENTMLSNKPTMVKTRKKTFRFRYLVLAN